MADPKFANRLIKESSPYLAQHAHNPVDWYPWGDEALAEAKAKNKPIFLSIGYSACHWCHVMEHESFEDPAVAEVMNELFINIKVDREERPDLDQIYMTAVQLLTHHGGWPMSVWLTPDLKPFHGGTYFPPEPRHGLPSFTQILRAVGDAWKTRRKEVDDAAENLTHHIQEAGLVEPKPGTPSPDLIKQAAPKLMGYADLTWGGLGQAPKFPHSVELRLLLRAYLQTNKLEYVDFVALTLSKMAQGGIYDQLGGGFHRYSTDGRWLVPHFEKMLYDNALISSALLEAWQVTSYPLFEKATRETLDYCLLELHSPLGPFYSTQDADSEGVEGKFFVWTKNEVIEILGEKAGKVFAYAYDVSEEGNWEHTNILNLPKPMDQVAKMVSMSLPDLEVLLADGRRKLFAKRAKRIAPGRDEKILTSWNGMIIDSLAVASRVLDAPQYAQAASSAGNFILENMRDQSGLLRRTSKDGVAKLNAYLEDYSFFINGLISLYEATFEARWLNSAVELADVMVEQFWDPHDGGFFFTGKAHETLIARTKDPSDNATPSGNSMAVTALARLVKFTGRADFAKKVDQTLGLFFDLMSNSPMATAQMLIGLGVAYGPTYEFAFVGDQSDPELQDMLRDLYRRFIPNKVVGLTRPGEATTIPLLEGKTFRSNRATVYICRDFACQEPVVGKADFSKALDQLSLR